MLPQTRLRTLSGMAVELCRPGPEESARSQNAVWSCVISERGGKNEQKKKRGKKKLESQSWSWVPKVALSSLRTLRLPSIYSTLEATCLSRTSRFDRCSGWTEASDAPFAIMNRSITGAWANPRNKLSLNSPLPPSSSAASAGSSIPPPPGSAAAAALARQQQAQAQQNGESSAANEPSETNAVASPIASGSAPRTRQSSPSASLAPSSSSPIKRKSRSSRIEASGAAGSSTASSSSKRPKGLISKLVNAAEKYTPPQTRLADLGGISSAIEKILELIAMPLCHPEIYAHTGVKPPRGVLLHGPPGCGKTMLAGAVAGELGVPFLSISAPSVVSGTSGESEKTIRDTFDEAASIAPCILFIDEIDAITPKRETAQREMERRIVAQLLTSLDDLSWEKTDGKPVMIIGATNRPDSLDPALRRAGRFDHEIAMGVPDEEGREQ